MNIHTADTTSLSFGTPLLLAKAVPDFKHMFKMINK